MASPEASLAASGVHPVLVSSEASVDTQPTAIAGAWRRRPTGWQPYPDRLQPGPQVRRAKTGRLMELRAAPANPTVQGVSVQPQRSGLSACVGTPRSANTVRLNLAKMQSAFPQRPWLLPANAAWKAFSVTGKPGPARGLPPSRNARIAEIHFSAQSESSNSRVRSTNSRPPSGPTSVLSGIAP